MAAKRKINDDERESFAKRSKPMNGSTPLCFYSYQSEHYYPTSNDDDDDDDDASSVGSNEVFEEGFDFSEDEVESSPPRSEKYFQDVSFLSSPNQENEGILTNSWSAMVERGKTEEDHLMDDFLVNVDEEETKLWVDLPPPVTADHNQNTLGEFRKVDHKNDDENSVNLTKMLDDFFSTHDKDDTEAESRPPNCDKSIQSSEIPKSGAVFKEDEIEKDGFLMEHMLVDLTEEEKTMFWWNYMSVINNEKFFGDLG